MNKSIKIFIKWIVAPLIATWLFYSLYQQVSNQPGLGSAISLIRHAPFAENAWKFWLVLLLVFVNWGLEAAKWQLLMKAIHPMSFFRSFKSVLCGVTFSLNLPNRMGEYAGRAFFVKEGSRLKSVPLSIAGSISQLIITMVMGCLGLAWMVQTNNTIAPLMGLSAFWVKIFLYGSLFATLSLCVFFFRLGWVIRIIEKLPFGERIAQYVKVLETFDAKILLRLLSLSLLRYLVFVLQYIFMLQVMQVNQNYWQSFWIVSVMFWILAIIPSFAIAELGIRGTVAKTLFAYCKNLVGVLSVTFGIWFINLFIPALIGSLLILGIKIKNDNDTHP